MGIASLVLGIIAFIIAVTLVFAPLSAILAVVGLILGIVDTVKKGKTGQKKVISIVGLIICAIMFVVLIIESFIVGLGLLVYNEASKIDTNTVVHSLDETSKNTFNSIFENYEGIQRGTMVKSLLNSIYTSNTNDSSHQITVYYDNIVKDPYSLKREISSSESYTLNFYKDINGYIYKVYITPEVTVYNNSIYSFNNSSY